MYNLYRTKRSPDQQFGGPFMYKTNLISLFSTLHSLVFSKDFFKGTCEFLVTRRDFYHAVLCTIASLGLPSSQLDAANTTYLTFTLR